MNDSIEQPDQTSVVQVKPETLHVDLTAEYTDRINFAMQQQGMPVVQEIGVTNLDDEALCDLTVSISLDNDECEPWVRQVAHIEAGATYRIQPDGLMLDSKKLATRTEAERTHVRVYVCAGSAATHKIFPIELLAFDQWPGIGYCPEMTAAFVTPNHPQVATLLQSARTAMGTLDDSDALDGYQSGSRQRTALIAEACFNAVAARNLGYISPAASFEQEGQRVRLVDRLCRENMGTCLDLTLLMTGLWEQCGLHPLVLLLQGHAMPAVWTHEAHLPEPAIDEPARIRNLIELGEIVPVESTVVTHRETTFVAAVEAAKKKMQDPGATFCAIDIRTCRKRGIRPLPLRDDGENSAVDLTAIDETPEPATANTTLDRLALAERAERQQAALEAERDGENRGRIDRWQTRLLDLSLRNRLINFRETARTLRFDVPDVGILEDHLAAGDSYALYPRSEGDELFLRQELEARHLHATETPAEVQKRLLNLYRTARSSIEETGANLLHLAVGMLKWYEADSADTARYAPIILLPVHLQRSTGGSGYQYKLALSEEPLRPNVTLLEKLRSEFGIATDELHGLPEDENGLDVPMILRNLRAAIRDSRRWEVEESVCLGLFSFNKFLMWRDLRENLEQLKKNRLVAHLVDQAGRDYDPEPFPRPENLDSQVQPGELFCTRDADSTQLAAVQAAAMAKTFVLEGPPGTGKSQTIANIIADSLARGKRVLFVAEKMAALSVVRRRLEEDGLGPFCLELHSAKASKKEVLAQLEAALAATEARAPADWQQMCSDLRLTRDQLNEYVDELHRVRETGDSLYRVLGRLSHLGDGSRIQLARSDVTEASHEKLSSWRQAVSLLIARSDSVDPPSRHPLRGIGVTTWNFDLPTEARAAIREAAAALNALGEAMIACDGAAGLECPVDQLGRSDLQAIVILINQLRQLPGPIADPSLLAGPSATAAQQRVREVVALGQQRDKLRTSLFKRYQPEFLELEHLKSLNAFKRVSSWPGPLRLIADTITRWNLRQYALEYLPASEALQKDLEAAREIKRLSGEIMNAHDVANMLGPAWRNGQADWSAVERLLDLYVKFHQATRSLQHVPVANTLVSRLTAIAADDRRLSSLKQVALAAVQAWNTWSQAWTRLKQVLHTNGAEAFGTHATGWLDVARQTFDRWESGLGTLDQWCNWGKARAEAVGLGLDDLVRAYEADKLSRDQLGDAFERSFGEAWFNATANQIEAVRGFNAESHHATIDRFQRIDRELIARTHHMVASQLAHFTPAADTRVSGQSEMGLLRRELQKKRRHLPTRKLIESMPNLLARLKPCFLMSPLSVAQYLDTRLPPFDLVVFDEASQIPVWDSIGAIARGTNVIVVGDSKQLPPTSFFDKVDGDEDADQEDVAIEDMESILKECNASGVPAMRLHWHYRSRHESLIAFSNHYYYDNKLHTFPSPIDRSPDLGVTFRHVPNGVYDRGGSRTNRIEATEVVHEVVRRLREPDASGSIGIVTFNQAQQGLIEDLLDEARRANPEIERFFTQEVDEPVFVKNLENVQGDERDTIIFSVGYGLDQTGKPSMNFGPLNKDGGERRLNVAVTRARKRLIVFSSLRADEIDLRRTQSLGVRHFKTFLDYADRGPSAIAEAVEFSNTADFDSGFEKAVWRALTDKGWELDTQVGCAGYRIDLGVRDPERPGRYLLGIECDGAMYHSAKTARDRDRLRQSVLEGLGWRIERIWSTEWWINPQRCVERIEAALEDAKHDRKGDSPPLVSPIYSLEGASAPEPEVDDVQPEAEARQPLYASAAPVAPPPPSRGVVVEEYRLADPPARDLQGQDVYEPDMLQSVAEALGQIVKVEGPVVEELALRRLAEWFGGVRVTERYRERFAEFRQVAMAKEGIRLANDVLWPPDLQSHQFLTVRTPGVDEATQRDLEHIPLIERVNAVLYILHTQFGLPEEELQREVAKLFGIQRVTSRLAPVLAESIEAAADTGRVQRKDGQISLIL